MDALNPTTNPVVTLPACMLELGEPSLVQGLISYDEMTDEDFHYIMADCPF